MDQSRNLNTRMSECRIFRRILVLIAVFSWPYARLEALRRPQCSLLASEYWHRCLTTGVIVLAAIGYTTRTSLARIEGNLKADRHISVHSRSVAVLYLKSLPNTITTECYLLPR